MRSKAWRHEIASRDDGTEFENSMLGALDVEQDWKKMNVFIEYAIDLVIR